MLFRFAIHSPTFSAYKNSTSHDNYILPSEVLFHCPRYLVLFLFRYLYFTIKCTFFQCLVALCSFLCLFCFLHIDFLSFLD
nr:MAG TPA: hypothetical protein [Caudoviricetes sp.]